ncbi:MAG: YetF domain-containing protein [Patescibacteria group bacterium]
MELIFIILRTASVYLFILIALRIFGKRELSQLSVLDLIFILLISNSVQSAMVGENFSLAGGLVAATTLFVLNLILESLSYRSKRISSILQENPIMLIYEGKILDDHLRRVKISTQELEAAVRERGVRNIKDVDLAVLEIDGNISVLSNNFKKKFTKKRRGHKIISKTIL